MASPAILRERRTLSLLEQQEIAVIQGQLLTAGLDADDIRDLDCEMRDTCASVHQYGDYWRRIARQMEVQL